MGLLFFFSVSSFGEMIYFAVYMAEKVWVCAINQFVIPTAYSRFFPIYLFVNILLKVGLCTLLPVHKTVTALLD